MNLLLKSTILTLIFTFGLSLPAAVRADEGSPSMVSEEAPKNVLQLAPSSLVVAREVVARFMAGEAEYREVLELKDLRIEGFSVALMIFDLIDPVKDSPASSVQRRIERALFVISHFLRNTSLGLQQKEHLRLRLHPYLLRNQTLGRSQKPIVDLYQKYYLWGASELWFLTLKVNHLANSYDYFWPMLKAARLGSDFDRQRFDQALEQQRPYKLAPLMLQYKLGTLKIYQYDHLLRFMQELFTPMSEQAFDLGLRYTRIKLDYFMDSKRNAAGILVDMQNKYNDKDMWVRRAIERAKAATSDPAQLYFLEMFENNEFRDMVKRFPDVWDQYQRDPLHIRDQLLLRAIPEVEGHSAILERDGNILFAAFGAKSCNMVHSP